MKPRCSSQHGKLHFQFNAGKKFYKVYDLQKIMVTITVHCARKRTTFKEQSVMLQLKTIYLSNSRCASH